MSTYQIQHHDEKYEPGKEVQFELTGIRSTDIIDPLETNINRRVPVVSFLPRYYPERVIQDKERDLMREKGICLGEYVNDVGAKNREFRVTGKLTTPEINDFQQLIDYGLPSHLICMQWEGEVLIDDSELEGPIGVDIETKEWMYKYKLNLVSTGEDEQHKTDDGIIKP